VTIVFADLVGFSTLAEHVEKFIGDAIVAVFGAPVAHEDDPLRAVESARIDGGELERAQELVERFGFERGPLGRALGLS
jgi:class 3 adenylate cyclase